MNPGDFRHQVDIQVNTPSFDPNGGEIPSWATDTTVWASVQTLTGKKLEVARQLDGDATTQVRMRFCGTGGVADLTILNRLLFGARILEPVLVINENERSIMLQVLCKEKRGALDG